MASESWLGKTALVSGVRLAIADQTEILHWLVAATRERTPVVAFALHVGGLVELGRDPGLAAVYNKAALTYADGQAVVLLARRQGFRVTRTPTTDLAPALLRALARDGKPARVAMIGGPPGLAAQAAAKLAAEGLAQDVFTSDGFRETWSQTLTGLRAAEPDVVFVGMGCPAEMHWCASNLSELPPALIITCGGWFGFVTGKERRAPAPLRRIGLEWVWRVGQQPVRLAGRYARGSVAVMRGLLRP